jgi:hypothetical protein
MFIVDSSCCAHAATMPLAMTARSNNSIPWATIAALISSGASVLGLILVAGQLRSLSKQTHEQSKQVKLSTDAINASTYLEIVKCQIEQDLFLAERPGIRRNLYGRINGRGRQKRLHATEGVAEAFVDMMDMAIVLTAYVPENLQELWKKYVTDLMRNSQALRVYWGKHREWYAPDVQRFFDEALSDAETRQAIVRRNGWRTR